ncbi:hypothetical protein ACHQM5_005262 [Ranunculus cassubicifolius]
MAINMRLFSVLFLVLLLSASGMGPRFAEGRTCESPSHRFKGLCFIRKSNCNNICQGEGFRGGHCRGVRRRCLCYKHC